MKQKTAVDGIRRRGPVQQRSQQRIDAALIAAEHLLAEIGPERISIPEIAQVAGIPRATIYQYFPDKYALFAHLAQSHFKLIEGHIATALASGEHLDWQSFVRHAIQITALYYNANKVAAILLLTGPFANLDRDAKRDKDVALARLIRGRLTLEGHFPNLPSDPDTVALAIEIAFACLKYGYIREGSISSTIIEESANATVYYLSRWG